MDGVEPRLVRLRRRRLGQRLAGEGRRDAADDLEQAGPARVDDAGLAEHVELLGRAGESLLAAGDEPLQQFRRLERRVPRVLRLLRQLPDDGQHRPLDGAAHSAVGGVARAPEGAPDRVRVEQAGLAERLGGSTQDLGEDDARVAARAHQRGPGQLLASAGRSAAADESSASMIARGQRHVRARVPVRDRVDVEVVDPPPVRLERRQRGTPELADAFELRPHRAPPDVLIRHGGTRGSPMTPSLFAAPSNALGLPPSEARSAVTRTDPSGDE